MPTPAIYVALVVAAASGAAGFAAGLRWQAGAVARADARTAQVIAERNASVAAAVSRGASAVADVSDVLTKEVAHARTAAADTERRVAALDDVRRRLLHAVAEHAARGRADPPAGSADGGPAASGPGLVPGGGLVELYRGADQEAASLADALERSRAAGLVCERAYDAAQERLRRP